MSPDRQGEASCAINPGGHHRLNFPECFDCKRASPFPLNKSPLWVMHPIWRTGYTNSNSLKGAQWHLRQGMSNTGIFRFNRVNNRLAKQRQPFGSLQTTEDARCTRFSADRNLVRIQRLQQNRDGYVGELPSSQGAVLRWNITGVNPTKKHLSGLGERRRCFY